MYKKPEFTSATESEVRQMDNGSYCLALPVVLVGVVVVAAVGGGGS